MAKEIERKFLVHGTPWMAVPGYEITQGYLDRDGVRTTRVRIKGQHGYLTLKRKGKAEFKYEVPIKDARQMFVLFQVDEKRIVRVRIKGEKAYLTIKGANQGATRPEFEYPIPLIDARELLAMCDGTIVGKIRHDYEFEGFTWEIDVFHGENEGLVVAEIELGSEDDVFSRPDWVAAEVTDDPRYFNSQLAEYPFGQWPK